MNDTVVTDNLGLPRVKRWFTLKTNGVANIRSINACLKVSPEPTASFWMPGTLIPRKVRKTTTLKKDFFFYDYTFVELEDAQTFEKFLSDRHIPAYFLHYVGTKIPQPLTEQEISDIKQLETLKQLEVEAFKTPLLRTGAYIEVTHGPFIGCKGVVREITGAYAVLEMNVFERPTSVRIDLEFLKDLLQSYEPVAECLDDDTE